MANRTADWLVRNGGMVVGIAMAVAALAFEVLKVNVASGTNPLSQLDLALFDAVTFFLGGIGLMLVGAAVGNIQHERVRAPHGMSAFLRAVELFQALRRFQIGVDRQEATLRGMVDANGRISIEVVHLAFDSIRTQVGEQVLTASHAMDDWEAEFPGTVAKIKEGAQTKGERE